VAQQQVGDLVAGHAPGLEACRQPLLGPLGLLDDLGVFAGAGIAIWKLLSGRKP
jgi:hypothetical protein